MQLWEKVELSKVVIAHALQSPRRAFATCSFGKDSRVLVDLALQVNPRLLFVGIDTGYEFPETLEFAARLVRETGMNFRWAKPPDEDRKAVERSFGAAMIRNGRYKCCEMKTPALTPLLGEFDTWITGLRRDENRLRSSAPLVLHEKVTKVNAIAFWTREDVWAYILEKRLSYHPLYDSGYASLGCLPCTSKAAGTERAGRFTGTGNEGQECGLHL